MFKQPSWLQTADAITAVRALSACTLNPGKDHNATDALHLESLALALALALRP